jgi:pyruvate,water dikinase
MDTMLNVGLASDPWAELRAAIDAVFQSWNSERAITYRKHHNVDGLLGTAVTVQMMCPAEVAGVLFTANPVNQAAEIIIESAFGLGEAIVLGKVTPDRFVLDKDSLAVKERVISPKDGRADASLNDVQLRGLAQLGQRVEAYFLTPCDIEWALSAGRARRHGVGALQSRGDSPRADADDLGHHQEVHVRQRRLRPDVSRPRLRSRSRAR